MQTEQRQILVFLDCGEISLAEAESMLDSTLQNKTPLSRRESGVLFDHDT